EWAARALGTVGTDDLVAAPAGHLTKVFLHPAVGVANAEVAVDELQPLAKAVNEALVERLERRHFTAGSVQHHDDDGERGEEVDEHERHVDGEISAGPWLWIEEWRSDAMHAPQ